MTGQPAFALLHGGGQGSWVWAETVRALEARGAQVLALDVPGCGAKRGRELSALDSDAIAAELLADIVAAGLSNVVLVGHSLAGAILPLMAKAAPDRFRRLIYLTCTAPLFGTSFLDQMGTGLHGENADTVGWPVDPKTYSLEQRYRAMFCNDMADGEADAFLGKLGLDHWPTDVFLRTDWRYDHLEAMPSSYILCERDQSLPPDWQQRFATRLHCDRTVRIGAGHQAMNTQPETLAAMLIAEVAD
jgi:pimeloyl-ACP methyl ester carboxylesterase